MKNNTELKNLTHPLLPPLVPHPQRLAGMLGAILRSRDLALVRWTLGVAHGGSALTPSPMIFGLPESTPETLRSVWREVLGESPATILDVEPGASPFSAGDWEALIAPEPLYQAVLRSTSPPGAGPHSGWAAIWDVRYIDSLDSEFAALECGETAADLLLGGRPHEWEYPPEPDPEAWERHSPAHLVPQGWIQYTPDSLLDAVVDALFRHGPENADFAREGLSFHDSILCACGDILAARFGEGDWPASGKD